MSVSYKKLWKLLIDKDMKKKDLCEKAGISPASVTKMGRNGHVTTEILVKICAALDCRIEDIVEIVPDEKQLIEFILFFERISNDYKLFVDMRYMGGKHYGWKYKQYRLRKTNLGRGLRLTREHRRIRI